MRLGSKVGDPCVCVCVCVCDGIVLSCALLSNCLVLCDCVDSVLKKEYCSVEVDENQLRAFVYAVRNHYWYQMYVGKLVSGGC